jgi:hypothetical protein
MAKTLATMISDVQTMVMDTSSPFAAKVTIWINDKYLDVARRGKWSALIDFSYTFPTVDGTAKYDLEDDFDKEIYVANVTDGSPLRRYDEGLWWTERGPAYQGGSIQKGTPDSYIILRESAEIMLDPTPSSVKTIAMPYKKIVTALTSTDAPVILDIEQILEAGACAEAFASKKNMQKSDYYQQKYEYELQKRISQENSQYNQLYQWIPSSAGLTGPSRFTGDLSYDSL